MTNRNGVEALLTSQSPYLLVHLVSPFPLEKKWTDVSDTVNSLMVKSLPTSKLADFYSNSYEWFSHQSFIYYNRASFR